MPVEETALHGDLPAAASDQGMVDRRELATFAFQRTRMPIVISDARQPDMPIVMANDAFLELTGYPADEVLGRNCRFLQGPDSSPVAIAEIRSAIERQGEATVEILNYRKDGTPFWNQLHISPLRDDDGRVAYYFASQVDVTELRRVQTLEEAEHRLLLEVDHRTKNVLAIVDSVVRLSKADNPQAYAASVQQRVQALSRTHMLLAENGWQEVALKDIVRSQVKMFAEDRVRLSGPDIMVPAPSVQPIGLAIHELAANAAVHGALRRGEGTLTVEWEPKGAGVTMRWTEQGGPAPSAERGEGFGNVLLGAVVERQLGGTIAREWLNTGLSLRIEMPALDRVGRSLKGRL